MIDARNQLLTHRMEFYELTVAMTGPYTIRTDFMPEGYCVKCKAKKEIVEAVEEVMKNGRKAIKGKCPTCGVVMFKILGGKAAVAAEPAAAGANSPPKANQPS
jgi:Zn finger protein HypA/HybF involved in hydrogenase expression